MLGALILENFKAFGERQVIPFAPITLIFGENSAGKSSVLQALYLLKQSYEGGEGKPALLPYREGGIVDLGTFRELIHDHDLARELKIGVIMSPDKNSVDGSVQNDYAEYPGIQYCFTQCSEAKDTKLSKFGIFSRAGGREAVFEPTSEEWAQERWKEVGDWLGHYFGAVPGLHGDLAYLEERGFSFDYESSYRCTRITDAPDFWQSRFAYAKEHSSELLELLHDYQNEFGSRDSLVCTLLSDEISFFSTDFTFDEFVERMGRIESTACILFSGLKVTAGLDSPINRVLNTLDNQRSQPRMSHNTRRVKNVRSRLGLNVASLASQRSTALGKFLQGLYRIRPLRKSPKRFYVFSGTTPLDVGYEGEFLADLLFRQPRVLEQTNELLEQFTGYRIEARALHASSQDLYEVRLIDVKRSPPVEVSLADVGQGVSQILPFIVQSIAGTKDTIVIEQPEVHIHPSLQAELGELLLRAVLPENAVYMTGHEPIGPFRKQFIVETHSEHLILRIQRLVREYELDPNDVSILFVSRGANGSKVERMPLDEQGEFIKPWPDDFFELSFYERFGHAR